MGLGFDVKAEFWAQWEGHRRLTLRAARAFPADKLLSFSPKAPLRPFGVMLDEIARIERAYVRGLAEDKWEWDPKNPAPATDAATAIAFLEEARAYTRRCWGGLSAETLLTPREDPFFFGADKRPYDWLVYCLDNEVHHRGQGYVYLREIGIEPPPFWER